MPPRMRGYVTDVPYVRSFTRELAPAWLDHVTLIQGWSSPPRKRGVQKLPGFPLFAGMTRRAFPLERISR